MNPSDIPERALFIYAHPDDIEFSAAGTAAVWAKHGAEVTYILITDGNVGSHDPDLTREDVAAVRRAEQTAAAKTVSANCIFLGYDDGLLQPTLALRKELVRHIRQLKPTAVVCGDPSLYFRGDGYINHPDHRAAGLATIEAVFPAAEMHLLYPDLLAEGLDGHKVNDVYISWPGDHPNYYVDISDVIELKMDALHCHSSQFGDWDPADMVREWNADAGKKVGFAYAELFKRMRLGKK